MPLIPAALRRQFKDTNFERKGNGELRRGKKEGSRKGGEGKGRGGARKGMEGTKEGEKRGPSQLANVEARN